MKGTGRGRGREGGMEGERDGKRRGTPAGEVRTLNLVEHTASRRPRNASPSVA